MDGPHIFALGFLTLVAIVLCFALKPQISTRNTTAQITDFARQQGLKVLTCNKGGLSDYLRFGMHSQNFVYVLTVRDESGPERACWVILTNRWVKRRYEFRIVYKDGNRLED